MNPETSIKEQCVRNMRVEFPDVYCVKISDTFQVGIHDFHLCINGLFVSIEIKSKTGRASAMQKYHQKKILRAGGRSFVGVRSWAEFRKIVEEVIANG